MKGAATALQAPLPNSGDDSAGRVRILHVISGLTAGGAETVLYRLVRQTRHLGHEVICLGRPDWYSSKLEQLGVTVHHVDFAGLRMILGPLQVYRLVKSSSADIVQGWMYRGNIVGGVIGRLLGKPVIWNIRCSNFDLLPLPSRALAYLGGALAKWVPRFVVNCSAVSRKMHARIGYDAVDGAIIPNGYDPEHFVPDELARAVERQALGAAEDCFLVGAIGRWNWGKGYPVLLRAVGRLCAQGVPLRLVMAGIDLDSSNVELANIIRDCGCAGIVQLLGYRPDVENIARTLDLHVLASLSEGFPNVVAETMLSGTPNVATDVGDSALILGATGWLVPPSDPEQLADAIGEAYAEWARTPRRWQERRLAARRHIVERFSIDSVASAYDRVWRRVAAGASTSRKAAVPISSVSRGSTLVAEPQRQLRIVHIINDLGPGGAETLLYRLVTSDTANAHLVISLGRPAWYSSPLQERGVSVHHLGMHRGMDMGRTALRLNRIIRDSSADVVQCWMYRSNVIGGVVGKAAGKPVVWGIHCSSFELLRPSSRALARFGGVLARWVPDFIINCSSCSAELHRTLGYSAAAGAVVHNGYNEEQFYPDEVARAQTRQALGIAPSAFLIGSISRWHPQKDIPNLLAAVKLAHEAGVPLHCLLVGHELRPDNEDLMASICEAGCESIATPLGVRNDVPDLARALDLHLLASRTEAFPNVIAETMLSGAPNAATNVGDATLMLGDTGWIVEKQRPDQLARAIIDAHRQFISDPDAWQNRRIAARSRIVENFSQERMLQAYGRVWHDLASSCQTATNRPAPAVARRAGA